MPAAANPSRRWVRIWWITDADHVKGDVDFNGPGGAVFSGTRKK